MFVELKKIECTKPFYIGFFGIFFYVKTNSSGETFDTRKQTFYADLAVTMTCVYLIVDLILINLWILLRFRNECKQIPHN